jgi:hypothetical protein
MLLVSPAIVIVSVSIPAITPVSAESVPSIESAVTIIVPVSQHDVACSGPTTYRAPYQGAFLTAKQRSYHSACRGASANHGGLLPIREISVPISTPVVRISL